MSYNNGQIPASQLKSIIGGGKLTSEAADAWNAFANYAKSKGVNVQVTDSYRPLGRPGDLKRGVWSQWAAWERYQAGGNLAAKPGTSNHGLGLAVDVPYATQLAIKNYGKIFGWSKAWSDAPSEPWHFKWSKQNANQATIAKWTPLPILKQGINHPAVIKMKTLLKNHGYWPKIYPVNNSGFGHLTTIQIKKFQQAKKLTADGIVGPSTWKALQAKPAPAPKPKPKPPAPKPPVPAHKLQKGIDISNNNGTGFNPDKIKKAGYTFVIHKSSEGQDWIDPLLNAKRLNAFRNAGLKVGVYHYLRPKAGRAGSVEARHFWKQAQAAGIRRGDIVPVIDFEETELNAIQTYKYLKECVDELTKLCGKKPIIYTGGPFWRSATADARNAWSCPLWLAAYVKDPAPYIPAAWPRGWTIWQYTDKEKVPGVPKQCDANIAKSLPLL